MGEIEKTVLNECLIVTSLSGYQDSLLGWGSCILRG